MLPSGLVPQTSGHPSNGNQAPGLSTAAKQPIKPVIAAAQLYCSSLHLTVPLDSNNMS